MVNLYFNNMMFHPQYVNASYYHQMQQFKYSQQQAFSGCLAVMAEKFHWK